MRLVFRTLACTALALASQALLSSAFAQAGAVVAAEAVKIISVAPSPNAAPGDTLRTVVKGGANIISVLVAYSGPGGIDLGSDLQDPGKGGLFEFAFPVPKQFIGKLTIEASGYTARAMTGIDVRMVDVGTRK